MERLVHDVYFTLEDSSAAARAALVDLCHEHLAGHDGILFFAAGTREESHRRDVNDDAYHVSLHICFESKATEAGDQTLHAPIVLGDNGELS